MKTQPQALPAGAARMVVNLIAEKGPDSLGLRLMMRILREVAGYYHMGQVHVDELKTYFFHSDGAQELCEWLRDHRQIQARPFKFRSHNHILAHGFEFVHDASLTKYLLSLEESA